MEFQTKLDIGIIILSVYICFLISVLSDIKSNKKSVGLLSNIYILCILHITTEILSDYCEIIHSNYIVMYILCTIYPVIGYFELWFYGRYYVATCEAPPETCKKIEEFNQIILFLNLITTLPLIPSGYFFSVSKDGVYTRGSLFFFSYIFIFFEMIALVIFTIFTQKNIKKIIGYTCFGIFPTIMSLVMLFVPINSIMSDVSTMFSCVILSSFVFAEEKKKTFQNEIKLEEYKTDVLLSQIKPHFIYNTLSTISVLCDEDPKKAQKMISDFSDYLRTNLNFGNSKRISTFNEELEHTKKYLEIEKVRFGDKLNIKYDIKESDFLLPSLSLQPIVENAVKHGVTKKRNGGTVTISTYKEKDYYIVEIADDGVGFKVDAIGEKGHYGITTAKERLKILFNGDIQILSEIGVGTNIKIITKQDGIPKN